MKLSRSAHTDRPWRIHDVARDFRVEDVWAFRLPGAGADDFPVMLDALRKSAGPEKEGPVFRFLFAVRWKLGALLGWDEPGTGFDTRVVRLRDRLPDDLRDTPGADVPAPFTPVYELADECAREVANKTVHAVMHLGWVPSERGEYELRMAVLVKANGRFGRLYMAAIAPFRYLFVYPALTRQWERAWRERDLGEVEGEVGPRDGSLPDGDYADRFTLATDLDATPEEWARAMFGDEPSPAARFIWRGLLGLRLVPGRSDETVAGWRITERGEDRIRLEAASRFLSGNLVVQVADGRMSLATVLRYDRLPGRLIWTPLSAVHRRLAPGLLREAAAKVGDRAAI